MSGIFSFKQLRLKTKRSILVFAALIVGLSSFFTMIQPSPAKAALSGVTAVDFKALTGDEDGFTRLKLWEYGRLVSACYGYNTGIEPDAEKAGRGELFLSPGGDVFTPVQAIRDEVGGVGDDWWTWCDADTSELSKDALNAWQISGNAEIDRLLCKAGYKRANNPDPVSCPAGGTGERWHDWGSDESSWRDDPSVRSQGFRNALKAATGIDVENPDEEVLYLFMRSIIVNEDICTTGIQLDSPGSGDKAYTLTDITGEDTYWTGGKAKSEAVTSARSNQLYGASGFGYIKKILDNAGVSGSDALLNNTLTCGEALQLANYAHIGYKKILIQRALKEVCSSDPLNYKNSSGAFSGNYGQEEKLTACIDGFNNKSTPGYCNSTYADKTINAGTTFTVNMQGMRDACEEGRKINPDTLESLVKKAAEQTLQSEKKPGDATTSCAIPGIGWLICPVFEFIAGMTDGIYGLIEGLLVTRPELFNTDSGTYRAWEAMRNFANVGFVIAFLVIIFSQLSGLGISNYGVKKLLPRLIVTVILVNVSFIISQLAVDISNIIGATLKDLLDNIPTFNDSLDKDVLASGNWFTDLATGVLAGTAAIQVGSAAIAGAAAITYFTGVGLLVPVLLAAILAVVVTLLVLITRQALVILLVVVSPLAFLAMLLPNTENWFKKWRTIFIAMLILFPAIALLFGGSRLAASILLQAWGENAIGQMIALAVMVVPLFFVPILLKNSLNAVPAVGKLAAKWQDRANGLAGRKAKEFGKATPIARGMAIRKQARENYRNQKFAESLEKNGLARGLAGGIPWNKIPKLGKYAGATNAADKALSRTALGAADKLEAEEIDYARLEVAKAIRERSRDRTNADGTVTPGSTVGIEYGQSMLQQALNDNDSVKARAIMQTLHGMGETGTTAITNALATKAGNAETRDSARSFIKSRLTDMKEKDQRLNMWAEGNDRALEEGFADHMGSLNDQQKASQSYASLEQAIKYGALTPQKAAEILDNENIQIKPGQEKLLINHAGRKTRKG